MLAVEDDLKDRNAARLKLDANIVVEAGAGTGKTTLLTDRILFLLLGRKPPVPVTALVALTFTEKAAGEIKVRLAERLSELGSLLSGDALGDKALERAQATLVELKTAFGQEAEAIGERARQALEDLDKAQIGTIHAFASHILRLYPLEAGVAPGFVVDEGERFAEMFRDEWAAWLDVELGEEAPREDDWRAVLRLAPLEDIENLARELCREGLELSGLGGADLKTAAWAEGLLRDLKAAAAGQPEPHRSSKIKPTLELLEEKLSGLASACKMAELPVPTELPEDSFTSKWPSNWNEDGAAVYATACAAAESASAESEALVRAALRLVLPFARRFRSAYARAGFISFDGLLRRARDLVRDQPQVRAQLKRRWDALLIDEFQDTDPLQGELLMYLAEEVSGAASDWRKARLGAGRLFVVGDPKQSIYRFRGADIAAYQGFTGAALAQRGALACDLKKNFRSAPCLIAAVNEVFSPLMRERPGLQAPYKDLLPGVAERPDAYLELAVVDAPEKAKAEEVQKAEAEWMALWVSANCGPGKAFRYKDVAMLYRSSAPATFLLDAFKALDIPYAVDVEKHFYGAPEVLDFVNLLKVLDDPSDRLALVGLLRSPLGGMDDVEIYRRAREGQLDYTRSGPKLFEILRGLRERVGREPLGRLVHAALEETALLELSAKAYHGSQTVSNIAKFLRLAGEASESEGLTLKEFIGRVLRDMDDPRSEGESPLADEHLEAVRILTIHKAKGLEFPVVFLANSSGKSGRGGSPVALADWGEGAVGLRLPKTAASAAMARLSALEKERQAHEALRLLYVAMTRAKERLIILGREKAEGSSFAALLAAAGAWPVDGIPKELVVGKVKLGVAKLPMGTGALPRGEKKALPAGSWPKPEALRALWKKRSERLAGAAGRTWTMSPTDYLREAPKGDGGGKGGGALVGQLCHKVLEGWDYRQGGDLGAAVAAARELFERVSPDAGWSGAAAEAKEVLKGYLASPAAKELAAAEILGRELPFACEQAGAVLRGSVDLLYRQGKAVFVADYKSDPVTEKDLAARKDKYEAQGRAYCAAVEKALGVSGVKFRLIFLRRPDIA